MPYFAAVAAVRIQSWISRTPNLRYVRGASHALTQVTKRKALTESGALPADAFDAETAEVAGVCVLRSDDPAVIDGHVHNALNHLQQQLPGVEWSAWRARADSYVMAYDTVHGKGEGDEVRRWPTQLPLSVDLPFARACARCSHELATEEVGTPDGLKQEAIGPDCARRRKSGANSQFATFDDLAATAEGARTVGRGDADNHLATVCADGNRIGDFFTAVAALKDPGLQAKLSNAVDAAANTAVDEALNCGPDGMTVAMKHFVGGDDIFASVAAPFAWRFVEVLGRGFDERFKSEVNVVFEGKSGSESAEIAAVRRAAAEVSLGVGVAFAHKSHPIGNCRETAAAAEKAAKSATRGRQGAVSWIDITVEPSMGQGSVAVPKGRFVTVEQLARDLADPHPALVMTSSARAVLASLLRPDPKRPETANAMAEAVREWATRVGRLEHNEEGKGLAAYLPAKDDADADRKIATLRHTVDRARWWPAQPDAETTTDPALEPNSRGGNQ